MPVRRAGGCLAWQAMRFLPRVASLAGRMSGRTSSTPEVAPDGRPVPDFVLAGVFDRDWYAGEAGRSFASDGDADLDYRRWGTRRLQAPHPLFDPCVVAAVPDGDGALADFLALDDHQGLPPHRGWDSAAYIEDHPDAPDHPWGLLGHVTERLSDDLVLRLATLDGGRDVAWGAVRERWRAVGVEWARGGRQARPAWTQAFDTRVPDDAAHALGRVSVVMPTRDRGRLTRAAIESVQRQTWTDWELIVVDDGSEDDTALIAEVLAGRDPRIRVIRADARGSSAARNAALAQVRGDFVAFLDSDNRWEPDFLAGMLEHLAGARAGFGTVRAVVGEGPRFRPSDVSYENLLLRPVMDLNAVIVRSEVAASVGSFDESLPRGADYDWLIRLARDGRPVYLPVVAMSVDLHHQNTDRVSLREPASWLERVQARHEIDWGHLPPAREGTRRSLVVVSRGDVAAALAAVRDFRGSDPWEAVVVDNSEGREVAAELTSVIANEPALTYVRMPLPVSDEHAATVGFARTRGASVSVSIDGTAPRPVDVEQTIRDQYVTLAADGAQR